MSLRRSTGRARASRATLLLTGLLALLAFALPGAATAQETQPESVLVCLADDDGSYVLLSVAPDRVAEYRRNSRNIVPAPVSGCPARVADSSGGGSGSGSGGDSGSGGGSSDEPAPESDEESGTGSGTAGDSGSGESGDDERGSGSGSGTAGGSDSGSGDDAGSDDEGGSEASEPSRLADTGSETWVLLGGGLLMVGLGSGMALRRRQQQA